MTDAGQSQTPIRMTDDLPPLRTVLADHELEFADLRPRMAYDGGGFAQWQQRARPALAGLMGVRSVEHAEISASEIWQRPIVGGVARKIQLRVQGFGTVLMYFCAPDKPLRAKMPAMICLQGHSPGMHVSIGKAEDERTDKPAVGDRDFALQCVQRGIAAVCIEQRGFGQRRDRGGPNSDCHFMSVRAMMLGRSLVTERVMDAQLALRWLQARPDIDARRIGVLGHSAGGTAATYVAAHTPGLRLAVVSGSFGPLRDVWFRMQRCMCGCIPGMLPLMDVPDALALFAPNPVVVVGGENDEQLTGDVMREGFASLKKRYEAAGAGNDCHLKIGPEGHRFYADLAWPVMMGYLG